MNIPMTASQYVQKFSSPFTLPKKVSPVMISNESLTAKSSSSTPTVSGKRILGFLKPQRLIQSSMGQATPSEETECRSLSAASCVSFTSAKCDKSTQYMSSSSLNILNALSKPLVRDAATETPYYFSYFSVNNMTPQRLYYYSGLSPKVFVSLTAICYNAMSRHERYCANKRLPFEDQLFMCLMKLRRNYGYTDLADRFHITESSCTTIFRFVLVILYQFFKPLVRNIPQLDICVEALPNCFKNDLLRQCSFSADCTDVRCGKPGGNLQLQKAFWSEYRHSYTLKTMICVLPSGVITYCSPFYPGRSSDRDIFVQSLLPQLLPGTEVAVDKGFLIHDDTSPLGIKLLLPAIRDGSSQFTTYEIMMSKVQSAARVHVERANEKIKNWKILNYIPSAYLDLSSAILLVVCGLSNLQTSILKEMNDYFKEIKFI